MKLNITFKAGLLVSLLVLLGLTGLLQAAEINGIITNDVAVPIDSSFVQLYVVVPGGISYTAFRTTFTDQDGLYSFPNIPFGDYYVFANAPEFVRGFYTDPVNGQLKIVEVDADDAEVVGINIQLFPNNDPPPPVHSIVSGKVFGNENIPLANKTIGIVNIENLTTPIPGLISHSSLDGRYLVHNVLAGTYKTCVLDQNNQPVAYSQEVTVTTSTFIDSINIFLTEDPPPPPPAFGTISGNVIGGESDPGEPGNHMNNCGITIGIVSVDNLASPIEGIITSTNWQGHYFLHNVPAGTYKTCVLDEDMTPIAYSDEVTVVGNDFIENINIILGTFVGYNVSGFVLTPQAQPMNQGIAELRSVSDSTYSNIHHLHRTAHLSPGGEYVFTNVPAGEYILSVWIHMFPEIFYPSTFDIQQAVPVVVVDQDLTNMNISLPVVQNYVISGYVVDDVTDTPLSGILVKTDRMGFHHFPVQDTLFSNEFTAITDATGFYSISAPVGRYSVVAIDTTLAYEHQFYNHAWNPFLANVIMLTHDFTNVNFDLMPVSDSLDYSISGIVTENGEAVTHPVRVVAVSSDEDWEDSAITAPNGTYSIQHMRPGNYYVVAYSIYNAPSYYNNALNWENAELVNVNANITGINFDLVNQDADGPCNLTGLVTSATGAAVENVVVLLTNSQNQVVGFGRTDGLGQYTISNVPSQNYTVMATLFGMDTVSQNLYVSGNENLNLIVQAPTANDDEYIPVSSAKISNYPNPFNPVTNISFSTTKDSGVNVQIFNVKGQCIKNLLKNNLKSGVHSLKWDGTDDQGKQVTSGIYLIKLQGEGFKNSHKITLMK